MSTFVAVGGEKQTNKQLRAHIDKILIQKQGWTIVAWEWRISGWNCSDFYLQVVPYFVQKSHYYDTLDFIRDKHTTT